jgi:predicted ATPase/DNA-binding XRE family transcriptional regulator
VITPGADPKYATISKTTMDEEKTPITFGEWLKLRRKAVDLTQDELAKRAGCSVGAVRKIEAGERRPSKQLAELIARALKLSEKELPTFMLVARGTLNLERLGQPALESPLPLPDLSTFQQDPQSAAFAAEEKPSKPASYIPVQATPLIGREIELKALERLFNESQCRLLTLTGIGGIGKTRLAIEFASGNMALFPGGVFFVPLASVNSHEKIVSTIADVLDFGFSGPADPREQLLNYISNHIKQEALFIFDNLEHLLIPKFAPDDTPGVVELISEILQRLPKVKILGTSRERLNLYGEWTYELHGLSVPPDDFVGRLEDYDSIALFVKIAQRVKFDFQILGVEQSGLIQICQLLEGVPLAIELAAAWVNMMSCQEIAQEIKFNMDFLTTSMRDIPERHRSIRATFDHSWKLLSDEERLALCQISVFHGGFDRDAASQIAGASLSLLTSLSTKSLVRRTDSGRYDLHEVIRQYGLAHLNEYPQSLETYQGHCEYYLGFLQNHEKSLKSSLQQEAIRELTDEIDNIRAAWAWAIDHKAYVQLGKAGRALGWYYEITGVYSEGIEQFEPLMQALKGESQDPGSDWVLGLALSQQGLLYFRKGEFDSAQRLYRESITALRPLGHHILLADALIFLGIILHLNGEYAQAKELLNQGLVIAKECNESWFEAYAIYNLGYIASLMGRFSEGYEQMLAGLAIWRALGDPQYISLGLNFLVPTLIKLGKYEEAKSYMQESLILCRRAKNLWGMGTAYRYLGLVSIATGRYQEAQTYLLESLEIFGENIVGWHIARSLTYLGDATRLVGDYSQAGKNYQDALRLSIDAQAIPIALDALWGLSNLQSQTGKLENALVLCYAILYHPASEAETKQHAEQLRTEIELKLDPEQVAAARTMAEQKSFEWIVREVLRTTI